LKGIEEDIDVVSAGFTKAIQCKYHETRKKYKPSDIAKPICSHWFISAKNKDKDIQYTMLAFQINSRLKNNS
jgi:hypothetical protein